MRIRFRIAALGCCLAGVMSAFSAALGQDDSLKREREALKLISDFADDLCTKIPLTGGTDSLELSGNAKAELKGLAKQIADLGFEAAAKSKDAEYQGVLQRDLAKTLKENTDCRREVWRDLNGRLLGERVTQPTNMVPPGGTPGGQQVPSAADGYPLTLESGATAKAAHAKYTILAATLDRFSTDKLDLKFTIRFTNDGDAWKDRTVMAENFRLIVDDVPLAPTESMNETVPAGGTKEGNVAFLIPVHASTAILRVGRPEYGTSEILIELRPSAVGN